MRGPVYWVMSRKVDVAITSLLKTSSKHLELETFPVALWPPYETSLLPTAPRPLDISFMSMLAVNLTELNSTGRLGFGLIWKVPVSALTLATWGVWTNNKRFVKGQHDNLKTTISRQKKNIWDRPDPSYQDNDQSDSMGPFVTASLKKWPIEAACVETSQCDTIKG